MDNTRIIKELEMQMYELYRMYYICDKISKEEFNYATKIVDNMHNDINILFESFISYKTNHTGMSKNAFLAHNPKIEPLVNEFFRYIHKPLTSTSLDDIIILESHKTLNEVYSLLWTKT